jgi:hypothetical protein
MVHLAKSLPLGLMPNIQHDKRYIMNRKSPPNNRSESSDSMVPPVSNWNQDNHPLAHLVILLARNLTLPPEITDAVPKQLN